MVVFHYGSIVLFNIRDQDVDGYLKLVEKYANGLLPERRKDGKPLFLSSLLDVPVMILPI